MVLKLSDRTWYYTDVFLVVVENKEITLIHYCLNHFERNTLDVWDVSSLSI
jgi:hypothetical protein